MNGATVHATVRRCVLLVAPPGAAHHSFSAEFDIDKPVTLSGAITEIRWSNPHAWIYMDVKDAGGKMVNWAFELAAANALYRRGWRKDDVTIGAVVTVNGFLARNGTPMANTDTIMLPDGRRLFAGAAAAAESPSR